MFKKILLVIIFSLPIVLPLLHNGYFPSHDGEWAVVRLGEMTRLLRDGQFPARWSINLNFGYGYPLFNFTYPLPYYLGIVFYLAKFGLIGSIKTLFFLTVPLSAVFMFYACRQFAKDDWGAILGSMLYVYFPYRIVDIYVRGSIGESLSFVLFPIIIWLLKKNKFVLSAIFYAALILTHNIMAVIFTPIILALLLLEHKKIFNYLGFFTLSYGLAAFFWIPAILEKGLILVSQVPIADRNLHFLKLPELFTPRWGYGVPNDPNGFGYFLGFSQIIVLAILILKLKRTIWPFVLLIGFYLFMFFPISSPIWKFSPLLKDISYPWTLLAPLGFTIALISAILVKSKPVIILLTFLSVIIVLPHAKPLKYLSTDDNYYLTNDATTTSSSELMPLWVKDFPTSRPKTIVNNVNDLHYNSKKIEFSADFTENKTVQINQIYFPGWQAFIDGNQMLPNYDNPKGLMEFPVSKGLHRFVIRWTETPLRLTADIISLGSLVLAFFLVLKNNWKPLAKIKKWEITNQN